MKHEPKPRRPKRGQLSFADLLETPRPNLTTDPFLPPPAATKPEQDRSESKTSEHQP